MIMKAKPHPEQGFRSCLGIIRPVDSYGPQRIEAAVRRANDIRATNLRSIKSILDKVLDKDYAPSQVPDHPPIHPVNIRGRGTCSAEDRLHSLGTPTNMAGRQERNWPVCWHSLKTIPHRNIP